MQRPLYRAFGRVETCNHTNLLTIPETRALQIKTQPPKLSRLLSPYVCRSENGGLRKPWGEIRNIQSQNSVKRWGKRKERKMAVFKIKSGKKHGERLFKHRVRPGCCNHAGTLPLQAVLVHGAVRVEEVNEGEVVPLPHLPVIGVVGGGHFDDPRPEFLGRGNPLWHTSQWK